MNLNFNAETVAPMQSFEPLPVGYYTAMITSSESKPTKSGTGTILNLRFDILDGEFKGRIIFVGLNVFNASPVAEGIARSELGSICRAVNVMQLTDSSQLHSRPMKIKLAIQPAKDGYDAKNVIKEYSSLSSNPSTAPATQEATVVASGKAPAPWEK
jgi:hypothetical protein